MRDSLVDELKSLSSKISEIIVDVNVDADFDEVEKNIDLLKKI